MVHSREAIAPSLQKETNLKCKSGDLAHASRQNVQRWRLQLQLSKTKKHCLIMAQKTATRKHSFKSCAINERTKGGKKRETADVQMEKGEKR